MSKSRKAVSTRKHRGAKELCLAPDYLLSNHHFLQLLEVSACGLFEAERLGAWVLADWLEEQGDFALAECFRESLHSAQVIPLPESHRLAWRPVIGCHQGLFYCGGRRLLGPALKANRPGLELVQTLDLQACGLSAEQLRRLLDCKKISQVVRLNLRDNFLGNLGATLLAQNDRLGNLMDLSLWGCQINREGAQNLALAANLTNLKKLNMRNNPLMREGAQHILESARLSCLDTLVLQRIHFNDGPFASNPGWPRLRMLYLGSNRIGPEVLRALVSSNRLNGLEYLELNGNLIRSLGAKILATAHHWPKLQTLELRDNRIGPGGARMLKNMSLPGLKLFDIRDNWLGETGTALLRVSPLNQNKAKLKLGKNKPRPRLPLGMRPVQAGNMVRQAWRQVRRMFGI
jgi:hypothetical protein